MYGRIGETGEDSGQVFAHGDVPPSAGFDNREDGGDFGSGLLAADVDPVFATDRHRAHGVFGKIVAELEFRVFQEEREFGPKRQCVIRGFAQGARGQCCSTCCGNCGLDLLEQSGSSFSAQDVGATWSRFAVRASASMANSSSMSLTMRTASTS